MSPDASLRGMWSGAITFGLVTVPVALASALPSTRTALHMVGPSGAPLKRIYRCSHDKQTLSADDLVRAYPLASGELVPLDDQELASVEPEKSREIALARFVARTEIDPRYFDHAYLLVPASETVHAYLLLAQTMHEMDCAGLATFVMRGKAHAVAILSEGTLLRAETLRFVKEVRSPDELGLVPAPQVGCDAERAWVEIIRAHASDQLPEELLHNRTEARLQALIAEKSARGLDVVDLPQPLPNEAPAADNVIDLMERLRASLGASAPVSKPDDQTRAELYQQAAALHIEGRSKMNKQQLARAIGRTRARS